MLSVDKVHLVISIAYVCAKLDEGHPSGLVLRSLCVTLPGPCSAAQQRHLVRPTLRPLCCCRVAAAVEDEAEQTQIMVGRGDQGLGDAPQLGSRFRSAGIRAGPAVPELKRRVGGEEEGVGGGTVLDMGQCVTKCRNPSSSLGSKSGDKDPGGKSHCKKGGGGVGAGGRGVCKEEAGLACAKPTADLLANGTKKMEADNRVAPFRPEDARKEEPAAGGEEYSVPRIEELFCCYKDELDDAILEEGMERLCCDLCVDPAEFRVLVLAWKFQAATMREFVEGCKALRADSLEGIYARFPCMLLEVRAEDNFKDLYRFTFQFGLDSEEGQRSLHRDIAIALWRLVFTQDAPAILDCWLDFLTENPSGVKGISRDTWNMFLNFTQVIGPDLSNYSEDEAWPSLFDTFVEWEVERRRKEEERRCAEALADTPEAQESAASP
ncbi:hypothetical protein JZ751_015067 [Albula glossodonta]|uniref:DCN1-like protein n=1 Tax=Albula glossodonta TaxID=121402 RepID=A0A8T2NUE5_9TELE|nr:hypothetical protein JZ751_015067 [Albula glossodonta]